MAMFTVCGSCTSLGHPGTANLTAHAILAELFARQVVGQFEVND
jgi:hypothetical protein